MMAGFMSLETMLFAGKSSLVHMTMSLLDTQGSRRPRNWYYESSGGQR